MIDADAVLKRLRNPHIRRELYDARRLRRGGRRRERIRIGGVGDHVTRKAAGLRVQDIGDHHRTAAIVEDAHAGAEHVRFLVAGCVGHRQARRDVVVVVEVVLPVVAQAVADGEPGPHLPVILDVGADLLLEQRDVAVALLLDERVRRAARVRVEAGEIERPADVGPILEAPAAPVRQLEAGLDQMLALDPHQALVHVDVGLGADEIALSTAAGERASDDDAAIRGAAGRRFALVSEEHLELVDQRRAQDGLLSVGHLLFVMPERRRGAGQRRAPGTAVLVELVLIVRPDRERVPVADLTRDAARDERAAARLRQCVLNDAGRPERIDERLLVVAFIVGRQHERRLAAVSERAAEEPLENPPLFRRLGLRERIARVEVRVAEDQVRFAAIFLRAGLGKDLDAAAAGPRVLRRVGILVDADLLHGRRAHVQRVHFHAVDDDGDATVAERSGIEKAREGHDVVVVEDRQTFEHALVDRHRIDIARRVRIHLLCSVADGDLLGQAGDGEDQLLGARGARSDAHARGGRIEPLILRPQLVLTRHDLLEAERARAVGGRRLDH